MYRALFDELATVSGPRKPRGIRHPLPLLLAAAGRRVIACLANTVLTALRGAGLTAFQEGTEEFHARHKFMQDVLTVV